MIIGDVSYVGYVVYVGDVGDDDYVVYVDICGMLRLWFIYIHPYINLYL